MNKEEQIVPKLRFPEFRNEEEWLNKPLNSLCKFVRGPFGGALKKEIFVKDGYAVYEQSQAIYNQFDSFRYFITKEKFEELKRFAVDSNDIIMSCSGTMGKFAIVPEKFKIGVINQALLKLTVKSNLNVDFIKVSLELPLNQNKLLAQSAGGAIKNVVGVSELKKIEISIPKIKEQQKIASCLSSLDEVIKAEAEKLELLEEHKKGLLQQLFPQEGETQPKYRFPEFEKEGDWEFKEVGELFEVTRGYVLSMSLVSKNQTEKNNFPVYSSQTKNKGLAGFYNEYLYEDAITWTTDGANAGDVNFRKGKFYCTNVCGVLINKKGFANKCVAEIINSLAKNHVSYVGNPKLMNGVMRKIKIAIPNLKEQQKIANLLSNVDKLLDNQAQKIEDLQAHKKGLLQQLFPNINNVAI